MKKFFVAPLVFLTIGAISVAGAPAAAADVIEPDPVPATIVVGTPSVLTLPGGDGVRDATTFEVSADVATTVALQLVDPADERVIQVLPDAVLTEESLSATVPLDLAGVERAGGFALRATPTGGETQSIKVMIGSGQPQFANLSLNRDVIHTWKKAKSHTVRAEMHARDETGEAVPFTGALVAQVGKKSLKVAVASKTGAVTRTTIAASALSLGTGKLTFSATAEGLTSTASAKLTVKNVAISRVKLGTSQTTIYPSKDGYLDATRFSVSTTTTTGATVPAKGTVTVARNGRTVRTWRLSSSKNWTAAWDGRVGGRVVPGTYTVKVAVAGPEGAAKTATSKVTVKKGKLVTKTSRKTHDASSILKRYAPLDYDEDGYCAYQGRTFACIGYDAYFGDDVVSLLAFGEVSVPSAVRNSAKYGGAKVRMSLNASDISGQAAWGYGSVADPTAKVTTMRVGSTSAGWYGIPASTRRLGVTAATGEYSYFFAETITITYSYKVMST